MVGLLTLVLLHSPLLGPAVWGPVARELSLRGYRVHVIQALPTPPRTVGEVMDHFLSEVPRDREVILVPHSNAGLYVPTLVEHREVVGAVFVDAGLPPSTGEAPMAPPKMVAMLADKVDGDGLLPPWTTWWEEADIAELFPNNEVRVGVEREQPRLPLSYFSASLSTPPGWDTDLAGAYLAFGGTYGADLRRAEEHGWPVATMLGSHLHQLIDPVAVTQELQTLLAAIGVPDPNKNS